MPIKSNNTTGNPYHSEKDGKFVSADDANNKENQPLQSNNIDNSKLKNSISDIGNTSKAKIKANVNLKDMISRLNDLNQCANVPKLVSARDVENNIENYFSKQVCNKIVELYGNSDNCSSYQFRPKSNPNKVLEIFPNVLAKYRFKDNHAHYIDERAYQQMLYQPNSDYIKIYRGMSSQGEKAQAIMDSYCDASVDRFDLLCPNSGNCYGSNIYTSYNIRVAQNYAGRGSFGYGGTVIYGILDKKNAHTMEYEDIEEVQYNLSTRQQTIESKVSQKLLSMGVDESKSSRIAHSFAYAVSHDIGLVAILLGIDYFAAPDGQSQRNILNASRWYINKDRR